MNKKINLAFVFILFLSLFVLGQKVMAQDNTVTIEHYQVKVSTPDRAMSVSYTHLTLPTNREV